MFGCVHVVFFYPLTKKAVISESGARCGACLARTLRKFALNVRALCMRRSWDGFDGVCLPLSRFFSAHVRLQLPFGENPEWGGGQFSKRKITAARAPGVAGR